MVSRSQEMPSRTRQRSGFGWRRWRTLRLSRKVGVFLDYHRHEDPAAPTSKQSRSTDSIDRSQSPTRKRFCTAPFHGVGA